MKKLFIMFMIVTLVFGVSGVYAQSEEATTEEATTEEETSDSIVFEDVDESDWFYSYVMLMAEYGIINGYDVSEEDEEEKFEFRPYNPVSRAEFAKMMVLTLGLDLVDPTTPSFEDVETTNWEYKYVETAKQYLTGWSTTQGYYYRPDNDAVREDMAVAIVNGLGIDVASTDLSVLEDFTDKDKISTNLLSHVAAAKNEGIMIGNSSGEFQPQDSITRAEAATLLARLIMTEKVTFDEEKITFDSITEETTTDSITLDYTIDGDNVVFDWNEVDVEGFNYYKVVLSKYDSTPQYSENGHAKAISNSSTTSHSVYEGHTYYGGDVGCCIEGGETYYASITVVYSGGKFTSNVVQVTIPDKEDIDETDKTPVLEGSVVNGGILLNWTETTDSGFSYYKVVLSSTNSSPSYPDEGYVTYIQDTSQSSYFVEADQYYYGSETLDSGKSYYIAITAVYNDGKYTSNVLYKTLP